MIARFCDHVSICILKENVPVCVEKASSQLLCMVTRPHITVSNYWFTGLRDWTIGGQQLDDITIRVTERTYIVVIPRATLNI